MSLQGLLPMVRRSGLCPVCMANSASIISKWRKLAGYLYQGLHKPCALLFCVSGSSVGNEVESGQAACHLCGLGVWGWGRALCRVVSQDPTHMPSARALVLCKIILRAA